MKGAAPALVFINPKSAFNIGRALRLASCYGFAQVWYSGERVAADIERQGRIPREERMKAYQDVELLRAEEPLRAFTVQLPASGLASGFHIVCVEVLPSAQSLHSFQHPPNPVYVFGPEDGSLDRSIRVLCRSFVTIPTRHCLNVADAAGAVMWDRQHKLWLAGEGEHTTPGQFEGRGPLI